jgi:hypothetical protein
LIDKIWQIFVSHLPDFVHRYPILRYIIFAALDNWIEKKAEDCSSAFLRLVPSPRYFANSTLTAAGSELCRRC